MSVGVGTRVTKHGGEALRQQLVVEGRDGLVAAVTVPAETAQVNQLLHMHARPMRHAAHTCIRGCAKPSAPHTEGTPRRIRGLG